MRTDAHLSKRIKDLHLQNFSLTPIEISEILNCSYTHVCECLDYKHDYKIVKGLCVENEYFLFTDILEKKIITDSEKTIKNGYDFNNNEKVYLRGYGFKF
jgi:hypothetical protein